jgi:hypothetical protein
MILWELYVNKKTPVQNRGSNTFDCCGPTKSFDNAESTCSKIRNIMLIICIKVK